MLVDYDVIQYSWFSRINIKFSAHHGFGAHAIASSASKASQCFSEQAHSLGSSTRGDWLSIMIPNFSKNDSDWPTSSRAHIWNVWSCGQIHPVKTGTLRDTCWAQSTDMKPWQHTHNENPKQTHTAFINSVTFSWKCPWEFSFEGNRDSDSQVKIKQKH